MTIFSVRLRPVTADAVTCARLQVSRAVGIGLLAGTALVSGCGGGGMSGSGGGPIPGETTKVTLLLSSTANDLMTNYSLQLQTLTLRNAAGTSVNVVSTNQGAREYIHLNGGLEPLLTVTVPQDTYTSAAATVTWPAFTYIYISNAEGPGTIDINTDGVSGGVPPTLNVTSPIAIEGTAMGLVLNMDVSQSAQFTGNGSTNFSITPTFDLTPITIAAAPTSIQNGQINEVFGQAIAVSASGFTLQPPWATNITFPVTTNSSTVYQGISNASQLTAGALMNTDLVMQQDGSLLATRVSVPDASAKDASIGPLLETIPADNYVNDYGRLDIGADFPPPGEITGVSAWPFSTTSATVFQIDPQFQTPTGLPFTPSFNASNAASGQNVATGTTALSLQANYSIASSVTLEPQTVNGVIESVSTSGSFTQYDVSLAPYDLLTILNGGFSSVQMYTGSATTNLTTTTPASGMPLRCTGMLFNDNGTLRMVCQQLNDGVAE